MDTISALYPLKDVNKKGMDLSSKSGTPASLLALPGYIASVGNDDCGSYSIHTKGTTGSWKGEEHSIMPHFTIKLVAGEAEMQLEPGRR